MSHPHPVSCSSRMINSRARASRDPPSEITMVQPSASCLARPQLLLCCSSPRSRRTCFLRGQVDPMKTLLSRLPRLIRPFCQLSRLVGQRLARKSKLKVQRTCLPASVPYPRGLRHAVLIVPVVPQELLIPLHEGRPLRHLLLQPAERMNRGQSLERPAMVGGASRLLALRTRVSSHGF